MKLAGRLVVVTGAASGIGRATVEALAAAGAAVVAVDRDAGGLDRLAAGRPRVRPQVADVRDPDDQQALLERVPAMDALVNDAGVGWVGLVADMPPAEIDRLVAVNVTATMRLTRLALDRMARGGHVVNVGSVLGWVASPPLTVYAATKFAVHGFSQGLRRELGPRGLYVTEVTPGPVETAFFGRATTRPAAAAVPSFPMARPDRVAAAVRRALQRPGWPGYQTVSVPRLVGLTRLGNVPGGALVTDAVARLTRSPLVLRPRDGEVTVRARS